MNHHAFLNLISLTTTMRRCPLCSASIAKLKFAPEKQTPTLIQLFTNSIQVSSIANS